MKIVTDKGGPPRNPYDRAAWELEAEYGDNPTPAQIAWLKEQNKKENKNNGETD